MIRSFTILIALAILIGINLVSTQVFFRFDATEDKRYTLSSSTERIVSELKEEIIIKVFLSEKLPPQVMKIKRSLQDTLSEYEVLSRGKLRIEYIDPAKDQESMELALALRIPELQLQIIEQDQRQTIRAFFGLALLQKDTEYVEEPEVEETATPTRKNPLEKYKKHQIIPLLTELRNFEYDFTSLLYKISSEETKTIGFLKGHGEHEFAPTRNDYPPAPPNERADYGFKEALKKNYSVQTVSLEGEEPKIEGIDTLVIAGPKKEITETEQALIQDFVTQGGNALFLLDQVDIAPGLSSHSREDQWVSSLLKPWGISIESVLVKDVSHSHASFSQGFISYSLPYPFWVKSRNLHKTNPITSQLDSVIFPWVSPLTVTERESVIIERLAETSENHALTQTGAINLDPQQNFGILREKQPTLPLSVLAQKQGEGKIIVIGDSDFVSATFAQQFPQNQIYFLNIIDSLTLGNALISIRSKGLRDNPIPLLTEAQKNLIRWGNTIGIPLLFIGYGILRRTLRKAKYSIS